MSKPIDDLIAELDDMLPGNGILTAHQQMNVGSGSAESVFAAFVIATVRDLCDDGSLDAPTARRLAAFGLAAYELMKLEKRLEETARDMETGGGHSRPT